MKWTLTTVLMFVALSAYPQALWRNFFTTNQNPLVTVVAGSNATVQASTVGVNQRIFTVNAIPGAPGAGGQPASENLTNWSQLPTNTFYWLFQWGSDNLTNWSLLPTNTFDLKYQTGSDNLTNWSLLPTNTFDLKYQMGDADLTNWALLPTNTFDLKYQTGGANLTNWNLLVTNTFDWKYQAGSSVLSNLANLDGGQLTNVPFSIWTNYVSNPNDFTNLNGLAFGSGMYGMTSYWAYASAPGIGPIGIYYNGIDTNTVISTNGGAFSGSIVQNNANSQAAPQTNELVTAGWVRNLLTAANLPYYVTTNIDIDATNVGTSQVVYKYWSTIPISFVRSYAVDFLTNNGYLGATITTNTFQELGGSILVAPVVGWAGGSGTRSFSYKAELYVSTDKTNWYGDWSSSIITLPAASTNYTPLVVDVPRTVATNAAGFYLQRRIKITSITFGGSPTAYILGGTNLLTGTSDAAHISLPSPTSTAGNAYLAANQTFTGSNTFTSPISFTLVSNNVSGVPTAAYVPTIQANGTVAWAAGGGSQTMRSPSGYFSITYPAAGTRCYSGFEDWIGANTTYAGALMWIGDSASGGTVNANVQSPVDANADSAMNAVYMSLSANTDASRVGLYQGNRNSLLFTNNGNQSVYFETRCLISENRNTNEWVNIGFSTSRAEVAPVNAVRFRTAHHVLDTPGVWETITAQASTRTTNATSVAVTTNAWTIFGIKIPAYGTNAIFYINGTAVMTNLVNVPIAPIGIDISGFCPKANTYVSTNWVDYVWYAVGP